MSDHGHDEKPVDLDVLEDMGYEPSDVNLERKPVTWVTIGFVGFVVFSIAVSWLFWTAADRVEFFKSPENRAERRRVPAKEIPLVQSNVTASKDMYELREVEKEKLSATEWVEGEDGVAKIPVEDAMRILAERGLPTRENAGIPDDYKPVTGEGGM